MLFRSKGKGAAGENGGSNGDLLVTVHVRKHSLFGRKGDNLTLEVPVSFDGRNATLPGKINGQDAVFQIDSGAFWSTMSAATAARYGLRAVHSDDFELTVRGIGGNSEARITTVKELTLFGVPIRHVEFVVLANGVSDGSAGLMARTCCASPKSSTTFLTA